ncbi:hypothetical protein FEM48_Zijuj05G0082200 [Ziziphus jujuba var. spinosa]|uniref:argininosuccinate synthase n=1 Tax=Ziziphus jujuba var. spinosa TaxID=714518 RepID=A0A978VDU4_ZIZJJ|nr:hypothetical protein FEM48_Zijuj05G0082200 [Ziziphus jujuba var. spinosa]
MFIYVPFELPFFALNPELNVVAPCRAWDITGREEAIEYAKKHNVPVPVTKKSIYSRDGNLWHLSHEDFQFRSMGRSCHQLYCSLSSTKLVEDMGVGRVDMVGMKSREMYDTPGGTILFNAVRELESLTLDREMMQVKDSLAIKYAELVYAARWFNPLRESMDAFMEKTTETTTGSVTVKLYKGSVTVTSRKSPYSLYS